jgi:hemerythrin
VQELYQQLKTSGYSPELEREVKYYTIEWFVMHIRSTDMKLVRFLKEKSAEDKKLPGRLRRLYQSLFVK